MTVRCLARLSALLLPLALLASATAARARLVRCAGVRNVRVFAAAGGGRYEIAPEVARFKAAAGGADNGDGPLPRNVSGGYRTVSWDAASVPAEMPGGWFARLRGLNLLTKGGKMGVSNSGGDDRFSSRIPLTEWRLTERFSAPRLAAPLRNNVVVARFRTPGEGKAARVHAFAAVFSDVDLWGQTYVVVEGAGGCVMAVVKVPPRDLGLSFAGVVVGEGASGAQGAAGGVEKVALRLGTVDLETLERRHSGNWIGDFVMVDDIWWGEPQAI